MNPHGKSRLTLPLEIGSSHPRDVPLNNDNHNLLSIPLQINFPYTPRRQTESPCTQLGISSISMNILAKRNRQQLISAIDRVDTTNPEHQELLISVLKDQTKTIKDIAFLKKAISYLPLFQKNPELLNQNQSESLTLFQEFSYQYCRKNEVVFNYGDFGYTYYIVLKGAVCLFIPKLTKDDNRSEKDEKNIRESQASISSSSGDEGNNSSKGWKLLQQNMKKVISGASDKDEIAEGEMNLKKMFDDMNLIKTFKAGEAFGEISLITKQRRTGTMICKEETHLMTLTKTGFDNILGKYHEKLKSERLGFLKSFQFLQTIPNSNLLSILHDTRIETLKNRTQLFSQGQQVENIYFLKVGEIQLSRSVVTCDVDASSSSHHTSSNFESKFNRRVQVQAKKQKQVLISTQGSNSHFGLEDLYLEISMLMTSTTPLSMNIVSKAVNNAQINHSMTAEIVSDVAEVYILNKNIFLNNLSQFKLLDIFLQEIKRKTDYISSREESVVKIAEISNQSMQRLIKSITEVKTPREDRPRQEFLDSIDENHHNSFSSNGNQDHSPYSKGCLTPKGSPRSMIRTPKNSVFSETCNSPYFSPALHPIHPPPPADSFGAMAEYFSLPSTPKRNYHETSSISQYCKDALLNRPTTITIITAKSPPNKKINLYIKNRSSTYSRDFMNLEPLNSSEANRYISQECEDTKVSSDNASYPSHSPEAFNDQMISENHKEEIQLSQKKINSRGIVHRRMKTDSSSFEDTQTTSIKQISSPIKSRPCSKNETCLLPSQFKLDNSSNHLPLTSSCHYKFTSSLQKKEMKLEDPSLAALSQRVNEFKQKSSDEIVNIHMHNKMLKNKAIHNGAVKMIPKNFHSPQKSASQLKTGTFSYLLQPLPPLHSPKNTLK